QESPIPRFTTVDDESMHAVGLAPFRAKDAIDVWVPRLANGSVTVAAGGLSIDAKALNAGDAILEWAQRIGVYADFATGTTLYRRVDGSGVEDFYEVAARRDSLSFSYEIALHSVAGLRLVGGSLSLLDAAGTPRLAMPVPVAIDSRGNEIEGTISVVGCA